jgi:protein-tyrosine phosphatase
MWEWTLNWDAIRDGLIIGSCPMTTDDIDRIRDATDATALLSLQSMACQDAFGIDYAAMREHGESLGLAMVNSPMLDFDPPDQRRNLPQAVRSLHELLGAGHKVYLHCTAGRNRAPLTALAYLTFVEMLSVDAAMEILTQTRAEADPSWEAYHGCREDLIEMLREYITVRAYYLSQEIPGEPPSAHWDRAEHEMIRAAFVNGLAPTRVRLDPSRE